MKLLLLSMIVGLSSAQMASASTSLPVAGQVSEYRYVSDEGGTSVLQNWVLEELGFEMATQSYVKTLTILEGGKPVDGYTLYLDKAETERLFGYTDVSKCIENGGVEERVKVPAGDFDSCRIVTPGNQGGEITVWYADVPNFSVKWTESDQYGKGMTTSELIRFKK